MFTEHTYQEHFPEDLYEYISQFESFDKELFENTINKKFSEEELEISISLQDENGELYAIISFWSDRALDDFHGMQVGYQNGHILVFVVFDEEGRDYLSFAPFSNDDEEHIKGVIFDLLEGGASKLIESY